MKKIIALVGIIGSGKDYRAQQLLKENPDAKIMGFSDGVREFTWNILGWKPKNEKEYEYFKQNKVMTLNGYDWAAIHVQTGRQLLENVADQMRRFDDEFWGKYWLEKVKEVLGRTDTLIVPDCRHIEEASKIFKTEHFGVEVEFKFCNYKSERYEIRDHSSEKFAQFFLNRGCQDGEKINNKVFSFILKNEGL